MRRVDAERLIDDVEAEIRHDLVGLKQLHPTVTRYGIFFQVPAGVALTDALGNRTNWCVSYAKFTDKP